MAVGQLVIQVDAGRVSAQIKTLQWVLGLLPQRVSDRFRKKALRLLGGMASKDSERRSRSAQTGDGLVVGRILVYVPGLDELIASAARRAARHKGSKRGCVHGSFLSGS